MIVTVPGLFSFFFHTNVGYDNISSKFDFHGPGLQVKVTAATFRKKNFVVILAPRFIDGF